ncbi:translation factor SUA5 [Bernardetia litoralis DSM 6794]|uniref:Threonylcarbamoyl-AMP synthase n=1 Tax=Bernardetia litoralis (strain ATCC 23117 / DSM 6794 / NBRC 15988 / NCIMB 1366 / Fx l1 / Sio-4) TaxID=880071 RepID=I4AHP9_BERLS|nr:L-threonylcarbamoyladenylate synthase [Bernardetia litoralis]AFM03484.1 translation factor SUA5 [Bernardetia litoralis DSM 6794]
MNKKTSIGNDIKIAKENLEKGNLVAIPTETVYGLAANAFDIHAVAKIFEAKNRPTFDPLIVHTDTIDKIKNWTIDFPIWAEELGKHFWAGALTLLLPRKSIIPDLVTSGLPHVAVRIPNHKLTLELLQHLDFPLAAPSANPFGYISPTTANHVFEQLEGKVSYILDGGSCKIGVESTIVGEENGKLTVFRKGGIAIEELEKVVGKLIVKEHSNSNPNQKKVASSGMLLSHYAPKIKMRLGNIEEILNEYQSNQELESNEIGILSFYEKYNQVPVQNQFVLSKKQDYSEAAQNLFSYMRELDKLNIKIILAELLPEKELGRAINDRLRRAAY